jgi:arsenate reductase
MKLKPRELLRRSEATYRELGLNRDGHSDDELVALMIKHPELIQRPIIERGPRAVLGRPVENIRAVISDE